MQTDGKAAYLGRREAQRGGVVALVPGRQDTAGARHHGIDTRETKAFTVSDAQVYWLDAAALVSEPLLP